MKKTFLTFLSIILFAFAASGCSNSNSTTPQEASSSEVDTSDASENEFEEPTTQSTSETDTSEIPENEFQNVYSSPDDYIGRYIVLTGRVFGEVQKANGKIGFQMFQDYENSERNTVVTYSGDLDVKEDDYVKLAGFVVGKAEGENAFGGLVVALSVDAISLEKLSYSQIDSPSVKTLKVNKTINQHGHKVKIKKVEFAEKETRVYLKVINDGKCDFEIFTYSTKLIQGRKQFEQQTNYDADYEEVDREQKKGTESEGIISFEPLDPDKDFQIHIPCSSDNWDEDLNDFIFKIKNK